ncbi:hypothetical protein F383_02278 [Gossypium arboreum]|uniref:CASP-like protein n=1 Tax=Gossypium arboreum TaxID=29729 RepID=A0A0B0PGG3_GOSAR|nr:hypothetical protein F383_02278 [Gossypium arboreum]
MPHMNEFPSLPRQLSELTNAELYVSGTKQNKNNVSQSPVSFIFLLILVPKSPIFIFDSHMMSNPVEPTKIDDAGSNSNVENPTPAVSAINRRWKREDLFNKGSLFLRGLAFFFSLLSFIIMASNKHGGWKNFDRYSEYRYLLAIAALSILYSGGQAWRQMVAYLLISSTSAAIPLTNNMREGQDNIFTDASASAISMSFFAFLSLALSAMVSGYKLSTQSYI